MRDRPVEAMNRSPLTLALLFALSSILATGCAAESDVDAKNQISSVIAFTGVGGYAKCTATRVSVDTAHCVLAGPSTLLHTGPIPIYGNRSIGFLPGDIQRWAPNPQGRASDTVTPGREDSLPHRIFSAKTGNSEAWDRRREPPNHHLRVGGASAGKPPALTADIVAVSTQGAFPNAEIRPTRTAEVDRPFVNVVALRDKKTGAYVAMIRMPIR